MRVVTSWRQKAQPVISAVLRDNPRARGKELQRLLGRAYPFGTRAMHPYKIWLGMVREALEAREQQAKFEGWDEA